MKQIISMILLLGFISALGHQVNAKAGDIDKSYIGVCHVQDDSHEFVPMVQDLPRFEQIWLRKRLHLTRITYFIIRPLDVRIT